MRYYIVDNEGNVLGDFQNKQKAELALGSYTDEEIRQKEIEIIEGD